MNDFIPRIVIFCCSYCSQIGEIRAVMKGMAKQAKGVYKARNIRAICTGRIAPTFIIEAYTKCADGIIIVGCSPGDCHYVSGNYKAKRNIMLLKRTLSKLGIEPERLRSEWITRCDTPTFLSIIGEFIDVIKRLGPLKECIEEPTLSSIRTYGSSAVSKE